MAPKVLCSFIVCIALYLCDTYALEAVNGTMKIKVVTTSGCGDTANFIAYQLAPAYAEYGKFLDIDFVPWGRTIRNTDRTLTCQFGANDCWANRLQRCALDLLKHDQDAQMFYMNCEFTSPYPSYNQGSYLCAQAAGLNLVDVDYCVTFSGAALDDAAEEKALLPMSIINFVPSIVFNDEINVAEHNQARSQLKSMICSALAADPTTGVSNC